MSEFPKDSAFKQASLIADQLKLIEDKEDVDEIVQRAERIASAMELDLNSIYDSLNVVIDMIDNPEARRIVEDIRDDIYRSMR